MKQSLIPIAYIDRFLYRGLWKLVQFRNGEVCLCPSLRFVALILIFGKVGYPGELLERHFQMAGSGVVAGNRSPFELPASMIASYYPIPVERTLPVLAWLLGQGLIFPYEEQEEADPDALLSSAQLTRETLAEWIERLCTSSPDWLDKLRGDTQAIAESCFRECAPPIITILQNAMARQAYPAMISPQASLWWCEKLKHPLSPLAEAEIRVHELLPDRLLNFADLVTLASHPATQNLRTILAGGVRDEALEQEFRTVAKLLEEFGHPYQDAVCDVCDSEEFAEPFGRFPESAVPRDTVTSLEQVWHHLRHRAAFALAKAEGGQRSLDLMLEFSCELWLSHLTQFDMQLSMKGEGPWGRSDSAMTLRPF